MLFRKSLLSLALLLTALLVSACTSHPDTAECGQLYAHELSIMERGPRSIAAGLGTEQAKEAVINYCLNLTDYQLECALSQNTLDGIAACEVAEQGFLDRLPWRGGR